MSVSAIGMSLSELRTSIGCCLHELEVGIDYVVSNEMDDFYDFRHHCVSFIIDIAECMNYAYTSSPDSRDETINNARQFITKLIDAADLSNLDSEYAKFIRSSFRIPTAVDPDILYYLEKVAILDSFYEDDDVDDDMKECLQDYMNSMRHAMDDILLPFENSYDDEINPELVSEGRRLLHDSGSRFMELIMEHRMKADDE